MPEKLDLKTAAKLADELEKTSSLETDGSLEGLTERQQLVFRLRMRGMTLRAIGEALGVSAPYVHKILKEVREIQSTKVTEKSVAEHVSDAISIYENVEQEALAMMDATNADPNIRLKAMSTVMAARDKQVKLLMELGYIERVAQKTETNVKVEVLQSWDEHLKRAMAAKLIETGLQPLEDPVPLLEQGAVIDVDPPKKRVHVNEEAQLAELVGDIEFEDDEDDD